MGSTNKPTRERISEPDLHTAHKRGTACTKNSAMPTHIHAAKNSDAEGDSGIAEYASQKLIPATKIAIAPNKEHTTRTDESLISSPDD